MSVDDRLVQQVRAAAERVAAYQAELAAAQSEYARALRALSATGAPPGEIAAALGLPEPQVRALIGVPSQSVQEPVITPLLCMFCHRPQSAVRKLIVGPDATGICNDCVTPATAVVRVGTPTGDERVLLSPAPEGAECAFCGKHAGPALPAARRPGEARAVVCRECVELCLEILAEANA